MTDKESDFLENVREFCENNNIEFSYYKPNDTALSFRFSKKGYTHALRHAFSLFEIENIPCNILMQILYDKLIKLFDVIRAEN